ncbi:hypothetical protein [Klebsiella electrica]|uniref:hypothetical protein n=1 Tax=Klebsiella electrica TaxID=1259973 RepID=UPI0011529100|nr:hypothetical protein [Klebsiella electrica]WIO43666.1 hypothetical protein P2G42_03090 [Klebsiella electrica]
MALRLPGLRGNGSPDKALAPPSGVPATGVDSVAVEIFPAGSVNIPRWRCAYRGYVGMVARIRRWRRHPGFPPPGWIRWQWKYFPRAALISPGGAALTGATWEGSPDKALAPPSGVPATAARKYPPVALRLPGLRGEDSPDKALAPPSGVPATEGPPRPGNIPRWRCAYRGYMEGSPDKALAPPSGGPPPGRDPPRSVGAGA